MPNPRVYLLAGNICFHAAMLCSNVTIAALIIRYVAVFSAHSKPYKMLSIFPELMLC